MSEVKNLIEAGVHFGHKTSKWCPKMAPFIWGARNRVYFIDVAKTAFILERAQEEVKRIVANGGKILWVGTKPCAQKAIELAGVDLNMPMVIHRWIGGTLTNFDQVKKGITRLLHLKDVVKKPLEHLKKKEIVRFKKEVERLEKNFGGIVNLKYPPAAMVVVDVRKEATAVKEAISCGIPVIGLVDTNSDPSPLTIAIPTNDDSDKAISYIIGKLKEAAKEGLDEFEKRKQQLREQLKTEGEKKLEKEIKATSNDNEKTKNKEKSPKEEPKKKNKPTSAVNRKEVKTVSKKLSGKEQSAQNTAKTEVSNISDTKQKTAKNSKTRTTNSKKESDN